MNTPAKSFVGLLFFASFLLQGLGFAEESISIRADEWYPMNGDPASDKPGFMIEIAQKVFGAKNIKVDYRLMPWERALSSVRDGTYDCVVGAYPSDAPDFVFPKENWGQDVTGIYVIAGDSWRFSDLNSLLTRKVAVIGGYSYDDELDKLIASRKDVFKSVSGNNALENNIKKLLGGRVNTLIESVAVAEAKLESMDKKGNALLAGTYGEANNIYFACSPAKESSKQLVEIADEGIQQLRDSGDLKTIMAKYGLTDWK
ncbi:substrate-binding periplasmic protein [Spartinivicinus ruber]|uniref:substrate-binding periplasmic protein n=1 Tax=Spartinivicinus ruber TaxID=2683272 RepID=UPI0013D7EA80|nr:transporter substrate-binding domain-containing protein [Spartinivicinus ruber]